MTDKPGVGVEISNHVKNISCLGTRSIFVQREVEGYLLENGISEFHVSMYTLARQGASNKNPRVQRGGIVMVAWHQPISKWSVYQNLPTF